MTKHQRMIYCALYKKGSRAVWNLRCPCKIVWYNVAMCCLSHSYWSLFIHPCHPWYILCRPAKLFVCDQPSSRGRRSFASTFGSSCLPLASEWRAAWRFIWKCLYMSRCPMSSNIQSVFIHPVSVASFRFTTESRIDLRAFTFFFRFCFFTLAMQASPTAGTSRK